MFVSMLQDLSRNCYVAEADEETGAMALFNSAAVQKGEELLISYSDDYGKWGLCPTRGCGCT